MGAEATAVLTLPAEVNEKWPAVLGWTGDEEQIGQRGIYTPHLFPTSDLVLCVCVRQGKGSMPICWIRKQAPRGQVTYSRT